MNDDHLSMDERLDRARQLPPLVSLDAAESFLSSHSSASATQPLQLSRSQPRTYLLAGGAMAVIVAIVFVISSIFNEPTVERTALKKGDVTTHSSTALIDDSVKQKSIPHPVTTRKEFGTDRKTQSSAPGTESSPRPVTGLSSSTLIIAASCSPEKISGLRLITLDSSGLRRLGIIFTEDGAIKKLFGNGRSVSMREKNDSVVSYYFEGFGQLTRNESGDSSMSHGSDTLGSYLLPHDDKISTTSSLFVATSGTLDQYIQPALITNVKGRVYEYSGSIGPGYQGPDLTRQNVDKEQLTKKNIHLQQGIYALEDLVPVRMKIQGDNPYPGISDYFYIYWYEPTAEFLSALPEKVRRTVLEEGEQRARKIEKLRDGKTEKGANILEAAVFPNPVKSDAATVQYSMPEAGRVSMSLYNIQGQRLKELSSCEDRSEGIWENRISVADIPPGMYLLAVTTESGQQAVQKIVVQR
jgi:hypothetical protein